tara:strand:- start:3781 stop:3939 length:159 start_codon:yes stop_codon:yes gene_type:complete
MLDNALQRFQDEHGGYCGQHPDYPLADWQSEVANADTRDSYWFWAFSALELD